MSGGTLPTAVAAALLLGACCGTAAPLLTHGSPGGAPGTPDLVALSPDAANVQVGDLVALPLPGAATLPGVVLRVESGLRYRVSITGTVRGGGLFWIGDRWGDVEGFVEATDVSLQLDPIGSGLAFLGPRRFPHVLRGGAFPRDREDRPSDLPPSEGDDGDPAAGGDPAVVGSGTSETVPEQEEVSCGPPEDLPRTCTWDHVGPPAGAEATLSLLLVLTDDAIAALGAESIYAHAADAVLQLEKALAASGVTRQVRLARTVAVQDAGSGDLPDDLRALECWTDGRWDEVHAWRDAVAADVVVLVVAAGGHEGYAEAFENRDFEGGSAGFAQRGFCVVRAGAFWGRTVFVHEIGHLLGCGHNADSWDYDPCGRALPGAHAYIDPGYGGQGGFSTVMTVPSNVLSSTNYPAQMRFSTADAAIRHTIVRGGKSEQRVTGHGPMATDGDGNPDPFSACDNASAIRATWAYLANLRGGGAGGDGYAAPCPLHCKRHDAPEPIDDVDLPPNLGPAADGAEDAASVGAPPVD